MERTGRRKRVAEGHLHGVTPSHGILLLHVMLLLWLLRMKSQRTAPTWTWAVLSTAVIPGSDDPAARLSGLQLTVVA